MGSGHRPLTAPGVILSAAKDLSSTCDATSPPAKTSLSALQPSAKTVRHKFFAVQHYAVAFPSPFA
jgi:hypothetical protein